MTTINTKEDSKCKFCGRNIYKNSTICPECGSYRATWKNLFRYWAGVIGLIAFILSAGLYTTDKVAVFKARLLGVDSDINVLNFNTYGELSVYNNSPVKVLIRDLDIRGFSCPKGKRSFGYFYTINMTVQSGESLNIGMFDENDKPFGNYAFDLTPQQIKDIELCRDSEEFKIVCLKSSGTDDTFLKNADKTYSSFNCTAILRYSVLQGRTFKIDVPCVAWARRVPKKKHNE